MKNKANKTPVAGSFDPEVFLANLTQTEQHILYRLLETHSADEAFDLLEMMLLEPEEVPCHSFTNTVPYAKCEPYSEKHDSRDHWFDAEGHIHVKNPSAYWLSAFTLQRKIGGTIYSVTGSYEGTETLERKLERIMAQNIKNTEDTQ